MSKALELVKLAKEGNASRFGDLMVAGIQEKVVAAVQAQRAALYSEGENPFAKKDDEDGDKKDSDKDDDDDKDGKKSKDKSDDDGDDD